MSDPALTAAPAPVESPGEFLELLRSSGLVDTAGLAAVESLLASEWAVAGPMPERCVEQLVAGGRLTEWHVRRLLRRSTRESFFLDRFKLLRPLGQGGMGTVYLGEITVGGDSDKETLRVAIKLLPKKFEGKGQYLNRFLQENWVAARLNHENIARAWDDVGESAEDCPYHYLVMEYIDGTDLDRTVRKGRPLPIRDAAYFIMSAAKGLHYAHEQGFVHRDIKPANLMVVATGKEKGTVKILDFGLVQEDSNEDVPAALRLDETKKTIGTPDYISPEQAMARPADRRSDIYSLGCTFHFLLTGEAPFETLTGQHGGKSTRIVRMEAHVERPPQDVRAKRPDVPAVIAELIQRMMEKSPDDRPSTAKEVAEALDAFLNGKANPLRFVGGASRSVPATAGVTVPVASQTPPTTRGPSAGNAGGSIVRGSDPSGSGLSRSGVATSRIRASGVHAAGSKNVSPPSSAARSTGHMPTASPAAEPKSRVSRPTVGLPIALWLIVALAVAGGLLMAVWMALG